MSDLSDQARDGPQIWDGLEEASPRLGYGTATSFLGASLAPWSEDESHSRGVSELGSVDDYRDPFSTVSSDRTDRPKGRPAPTWGSPPTSPRAVKTASADSHSSSSGRPPATTAPSSVASCHATVGLDVLSPALSATSEGLKRSSTWWDRIRSQGGVASPGASMPIRDPAPAPSLAVIPEASVLVARHEDPFSDEAAARATSPSVDEHGRSFDGSHFQSSSQGSNQTATSSMIDRATRDMMVVERMRSASGIDDPTTPMMTPSTIHADDTPRASEAGPNWGVVVSDQPTPALSGIASPQGDLVWNGPSMWMSPGPSEALSPSFSLASPPPLALAAVDLRRSTRRPLPVPTRRQTAGTTGVKAMVQQFEAVSAESTFSPPVPASTATTPERSIRSVTGSVTSSSHGSSGGGGGGQRKQKVEHGLVKKPLLFVANPDET